MNSISSGATGILLTLFPGLVASLFGVSESVYFFEAGVFLVLFAAFVMYVATRNPIRLKLVMMVTTLDLIWVLGSIVAAFMLAGIVTTIGIVLIIAVAAWVAMMALLQFKGTYASKTGI